MGFTGRASLVATRWANLFLLFRLLGQSKENRDKENFVPDIHCRRLVKQQILYIQFSCLLHCFSVELAKKPALITFTTTWWKGNEGGAGRKQGNKEYTLVPNVALSNVGFQ
jgi:hypothetical protein